MRYRTKILTQKLKQLRDGLNRFFNDLRQFWVGEEKIINEGLKLLFDNQGPGWAKLAKSTLRWRRRKGYAGTPILKASSKLRESLVSNGIGHISRIQKDSIEVGTSLPYASPLQYGAEVVKYKNRLNEEVLRKHKGRKRREVRAKIPARPFVLITPEMEDQSGDYAVTYLGKVVDQIIATPPRKPQE